jgi:RNA polymerase subunit RPABC4/transcription elongation factor Spt4
MLDFLFTMLLISWGICAIAGAVIAVNRGNSGIGGFAAGAVFGWFGLAMIVTAARNPTAKEGRCKACAEIIRREATICPHCGKDGPWSA